MIIFGFVFHWQTCAQESKNEICLVPEMEVTGEEYLPKSVVKTNLLYLATTTPNVAGEFGLAPQWTLDVNAALNPWILNNRNGGIRHWLIQPELRYWLCQRFKAHFVGLHGIGLGYQIMNIDLRPLAKDFTDKRHDGWGVGAGLAYGYHLPVNKRWSWEFTIGAGYIYLNNKYSCGACNLLLDKKVKHYFGVTKAGISLVYTIL